MKYNSQLSYIDLAFNLLLFFICLFCLIFLSITTQKVKEEGIALKTEYIIRYIWEPASNNDVDAYLSDPSYNICFFKYRDAGLMALDRDDRGVLTDKVMGADGNEISIPYNEEIISLRGTIPGEYIVNAHLFSKLDSSGNEVTIILEKVNPHQIVFSKTIKLENAGDEVTAFRFTIDENGYPVNFNELPKKFTGEAY